MVSSPWDARESPALAVKAGEKVFLPGGPKSGHGGVRFVAAIKRDVVDFQEYDAALLPANATKPHILTDVLYGGSAQKAAPLAVGSRPDVLSHTARSIFTADGMETSDLD